MRLPDPIGTPEFLTAYKAAEAGAQQAIEQPGLPRIKPKSLRWLSIQYFGSPGYKRLASRTQKIRRRFLERICERVDSKGTQGWRQAICTPGTAPCAQMARRTPRYTCRGGQSCEGSSRTIQLRHRKRPSRSQSCWQRKEYQQALARIHCWTEKEIAQFEAAHPVGSQARLALALGLYTTQRRADLVKLGRQHIKDGYFHLTQHKNRNRHPVRLQIWIHPELQKIIEATPGNGMTFLETAFGKPFTSNGFGNRFKKWCQEAESTRQMQCSWPSKSRCHSTRKQWCIGS